MSIRTNTEELAKIIELDTELDANKFIKVASALVDWLVTQDVDSILTDDLTEEIECYLAAHFYHVRDQQFSNKSQGGASATFQGQTGYVLMGSKWGQMACLLDPTGRLSQRSKEAEGGTAKTMKVVWLGTKASNQISQNNGSW